MEEVLARKDKTGAKKEKASIGDGAVLGKGSTGRCRVLEDWGQWKWGTEKYVIQEAIGHQGGKKFGTLER